MTKLVLDESERNAVVRFITSGVAPALAPWLDEAWQGQEHVPHGSGAVLAGNHLSYADPFVIGRFILGAGRLPHFLGKAEIFDVPVLGGLLRRAGQMPVRRGTARAADSFAAAVRAVEAGRIVCLLPEGTLTRDPGLWPMSGKTGAARIALTTGCPLIPVAMWGPERIIAPTAHPGKALPAALTRRHPVTVVAGAPIDLSDLRQRPLDAEILAEATSRLMGAITDQLAQVRGERPTAAPLSNPRVASRPSIDRRTGGNR